jgi:hypothetical protein
MFKHRLVDTNEERTRFALYIGMLLRKQADYVPLEDQEKTDLEAWLSSSEQRRKIFLDAADRSTAAAELRNLYGKYDSDEAARSIFTTLGLDR